MPTEPVSYPVLTPDEYINKRAEFKREAYRQKGNRYRWGYTIMTAIAIAGRRGPRAN